MNECVLNIGLMIGENLSQDQVVHCKSHMEWRGFEPRIMLGQDPPTLVLHNP